MPSTPATLAAQRLQSNQARFGLDNIIVDKSSLGNTTQGPFGTIVIDQVTVSALATTKAYPDLSTTVAYPSISSLYIKGAPIIGSKVAPSPNAWSLYVASGKSQINGGVWLSDSTDATATTSGGSVTVSGGLSVFKNTYVSGTILNVPSGTIPSVGTSTLTWAHVFGSPSVKLTVSGANALPTYSSLLATVKDAKEGTTWTTVVTNASGSNITFTNAYGSVTAATLADTNSATLTFVITGNGYNVVIGV